MTSKEIEFYTDIMMPREINKDELNFDTTYLADLKLFEPKRTYVPFKRCHICREIKNDKELKCYSIDYMDNPQPVLFCCDKFTCEESVKASMAIFIACYGILPYLPNSLLKENTFKIKRSDGSIDPEWKVSHFKVCNKKVLNQSYCLTMKKGNTKKAITLIDFCSLNDIFDKNILIPNFPKYFPLELQNEITSNIKIIFNI